MNPQLFKHILDQVPKLDPTQKQTLTFALKAEDNPILERLSKEVIDHSRCIHCQSERLRKHGFSARPPALFLQSLSKADPIGHSVRRDKSVEDWRCKPSDW